MSAAAATYARESSSLLSGLPDLSTAHSEPPTAIAVVAAPMRYARRRYEVAAGALVTVVSMVDALRVWDAMTRSASAGTRPVRTCQADPGGRESARDPMPASRARSIAARRSATWSLRRIAET